MAKKSTFSLYMGKSSVTSFDELLTDTARDKIDRGHGYLNSETVVCSLRRELGVRLPTLFYVYECHVTTPKNTDSQHHLDAARVSIPLERRPMLLKGNYWTDRNWHQGLTTAGRIRLRRSYFGAYGLQSLELTGVIVVGRCCH